MLTPMTVRILISRNHGDESSLGITGYTCTRIRIHLTAYFGMRIITLLLGLDLFAVAWLLSHSKTGYQP